MEKSFASDRVVWRALYPAVGWQRPQMMMIYYVKFPQFNSKVSIYKLIRYLPIVVD